MKNVKMFYKCFLYILKDLSIKKKSSTDKILLQ